MNTFSIVCVLYNPSVGTGCKILQWSKWVDMVYLVDNSDIPHMISTEINLCSDPKIRYIPLGSNQGIARALNIGCRDASQDGFKWVITFDQDSSPDESFFDAYRRYVDSIVPSSTSLGILTCQMRRCESDVISISHDVSEVDACWTSGSLMNMEVYKRSEGFMDKLFIDSVDFAYCLSIRELGYKIVRLNDVVLVHQIGNAKTYSLWGYHLFYVTHHNYIRRYYMTRNAFWLSEKYGDRFPSYKIKCRTVLKWVGKILLFEKDKMKKVCSIYRGWYDYKHNVYGKYRYRD